MRMMKNIKIGLLGLFFWDALLVVLSLYQGGAWLLNSQLAFLSSLFVTVASYFSYKRLIDKRLALGEGEQLRDSIQKQEDPYEVYDEAEDTTETLKQVIKEERAKVTSLKQTGENLYKSLSGIFSPFRLLSYLFLFFAFLYLANGGHFVVWAYVSGLFVVPLTAMSVALFLE